MKRIASLLSVLLLAACGNWNTATNAPLPDGSIIAFRNNHDVNFAGQDVSSTVTARCMPGLPCDIVDHNSGYERGFLGAVFQGTGPAAAGAIGFAVGMNNRRPDTYNNTTTMSNGTGSTFQGGAGGIGQGGRGVGGGVAMAPGAVQGGQGGAGGNANFAAGAVQGGSASANNGGVRINNTNQQAQVQAQQQHQDQTSNNWNSNSNRNNNQNTATSSGGYYTISGGDQHPSYEMNGHTYNWVPGKGYVDP
jgi:hypothetical protein